jgi:ribosome-associated protein
MLHVGHVQRRERVRRAAQEANALSHSTAAVRQPTAPGLPMTSGQATLASDVLLERVLSSLEDDKAEEIVPIPLKGKSEMADYMVVCSGRSSRQVVAIAENLSQRLKVLGVVPKLEGTEQGDWVLVDAGDVIVHVFRPEVREFYNLERIWASDAPPRDAAPNARAANV